MRVTENLCEVVIMAGQGSRSAGGLRQRPGRGRGRAGLTLIELMISMAILTITMVWFFMGLLAAASANRTLAMEVTANAAIRQQTEEVFAVAMDNTDHFENGAQAVLYYYGSGKLATLGSVDEDHALPIGPNGRLVPKVELDTANNRLICRFMIPEPGQPSRYTVSDGVVEIGDVKPDKTAVGEMIIYLDEEDVPPAGGAGDMWSDLGDNDNGRESGFDMNRDGKIEGRSGSVSESVFSSPGDLGILQLPIDVNVAYYNNAAHSSQVFSTSRRIVITGNVLEKRYQ